MDNYLLNFNSLRPELHSQRPSLQTVKPFLRRSQAAKEGQDLLLLDPLEFRGVKKLKYQREILLTAALILLTLSASVFFFFDVSGILMNRIRGGDFLGTAEQVFFILIIVFLVYGNLLYQVTRWGYVKRTSTHSPASREELESLFDEKAPPLCILIPSYKEDAKVVRRTLFSASLQDYPNKRVVLLIDDPPNSMLPKDREGLEKMRSLPGAIQHIFDEIRRPFEEALNHYFDRRKAGFFDPYYEAKALARQYQKVAALFSRLAKNYPVSDHGDKLLIEKVFRFSASTNQTNARILMERSFGKPLSESEILHHYRRIVSLFRVRLSSFERKRYINLSHQVNKAMNLNSYIDLIGKSFREVRRNDGLHLEYTVSPEADLIVPPAEFLIMLDADSLLTHDYAIRLIHFMTQSENKRVAVAQTPYNTIPNAPGLLERTAGATTDIQYIIHQGFTAHNATYWVGANALVRRAALNDIAQVGQERGFTVTRYIQDRTVIEDTESSIDLVDKGWTLYNYPERLAYSATPPDFGSLLIQRRRWANGGLLILPKLLRFLLRGPNWFSKAREGFFRFHYLFSITAVNFGLLFLLVFPLEESTRSFWLPLTALPYFYLYGRDLVQIGYRWIDLFRVYSLNLMLIPINIAGVTNSIWQGVTGRKIPFGRTPKVVNRTAASLRYLFAEYGLLSLGLLGLCRDIFKGFWAHSLFEVVFLVFFLYAIVRFIGLKESKEDLVLAYDSLKSNGGPGKTRRGGIRTEGFSHLKA